MTETNTGCFKCDSILMNAVTSLDEINFDEQISVYPNPTSASFFIKNNSNKNFSVKIFDVEGRSLVTEALEVTSNSVSNVASRASATGASTSSASDELEIKNLVPGIYFIEISFENSVIRKKLIISPQSFN